MNPSDTLTVLFRHNRWANLRILERCAGLTSEQLDATIPGTFGSIRDTLQHIVTAEQSYFSRISTGQPFRPPKGAPPLTMAEMTEEVRRTGSGLIEWAPKVRADDTVQVDWEGTPRDVPKTIILTQVINHATEHRAQIMTTLTHLGVQPPELDSWSYFDELGVDLETLHAAVESLLRQESFWRAVERLRVELSGSQEPFVWSTVALDTISVALPAPIKSCWIFLLKGDEPSRCHYHPNSIQHMIALNGQGRSEIGGVERTMIPFGSARHSIEQKWHVIGEAVPHEFFPEAQDMTVVSFHTCEAAELEEIDCKSGASRRYEPSDA